MKSVCLTNLGCLTLSIPEKMKNSICDMTIYPRNFKYQLLENSKCKSINLHNISKLIECFGKSNV